MGGNKIIKNPHMRTVIGSSGRDYVLIILFPFYGSKARIFEYNLFWRVSSKQLTTILKQPI